MIELQGLIMYIDRICAENGSIKPGSENEPDSKKAICGVIITFYLLGLP